MATICKKLPSVGFVVFPIYLGTMHNTHCAVLFLAAFFSGNQAQGQDVATNREADSPWELSVSQPDGKPVRLGNFATCLTGAIQGHSCAKRQPLSGSAAIHRAEPRASEFGNTESGLGMVQPQAKGGCGSNRLTFRWVGAKTNLIDPLDERRPEREGKSRPCGTAWTGVPRSATSPGK